VSEKHPSFNVFESPDFAEITKTQKW
jgi:hypothetical protein